MSEEDQGCLCRRCHQRYRVDLCIPDDLWTRIGNPTPGGLLCGACIMTYLEDEAQRIGGFGYLHVTEGVVV